MRTTKFYSLITFPTTCAAMRAERILLRAHAPGRLIPVPESVRAGCGLGWRVAPEDVTRVLEALGEGWESVYENLGM